MGNELATTTGQAPAPRPAVALNGAQRDLDQTFRLAQALAQSSLIPRQMAGKPSDVLAAILYGQELGIAPMQALQTIYVVQGRPTISAHLWVALARRAGHKVRVTDEAAESCTVEIERGDDPGHPTRVTYTLAQAKQAGLTGKDTWKQNPGAMLYARAVSTAARRACPEIAMGLGDESETAPQPAPARPTLAQVAAERTDTQQQADDAADAAADEYAEQVDDDGTSDADMLAELAEIEAEHAAPDAAGVADGLFGGEQA